MSLPASPPSGHVLFLVERNDGEHAISAVRLLAESGLKVSLATVTEYGRVHEEVSRLGIPALTLDCRDSRDYPVGVARLARMIVSRKIDIVHGVEPLAATIGGLSSLTVGRGWRLFDRQHSKAGWPQSALSRTASRLAHLTRAVSQAVSRYAQEVDDVPAHKIRVVYNGVLNPRGVPPEEIQARRSGLGIPEDAAVVSTVARLRREKGIQIALSALPAMEELTGRDVHYVIAGEGPLRQELEGQAAQVGARAHFLGHATDVAPCYSIADIVLMPSFFEGFPLAGVEAMASSRPLVASGVGGLCELVVDGETGALVPPKDPRRLAEAAASLIADPNRRQRFGEAGRRRYLERFTVERTVEGILSCYRELLDRDRVFAR